MRTEIVSPWGYIERRMAGFRKCPLCGASVKLTNVQQHARRAHPGKKVEWNLSGDEEAAVEEARRRPTGLARRERMLYPVVAVVVVVAIILGVVILAPPPQNQGPAVAPNFILPSSDGGNVRLSDFAGSVVLLDFMDPHCPHCQTETANVLVPLHAAYNDRVVFLSVDVGFIGPPSSLDDVRNFKIVYGATWTYVLDDGTAAPQYGVTSTPRTFILHGDRTVSSQHGSASYAVLSSALDAALGGG